MRVWYAHTNWRVNRSQSTTVRWLTEQRAVEVSKNRVPVVSKNRIDAAWGRPNGRSVASDRLTGHAVALASSAVVLVALACWFNQQQRDVIDYLQEENRVLREQIGARRLRFTDDQRRRLAAKARTLGRRALREFASVVTPDTLPA